jgi:hypothetical protein
MEIVRREPQRSVPVPAALVEKEKSFILQARVGSITVHSAVLRWCDLIDIDIYFADSSLFHHFSRIVPTVPSFNFIKSYP